MSNWETVPLASLVNPGRGISYGIVQPGTPQESGVPILRVTDIRNGRIATHSPLRVAAEVEASYARTRLAGGELLLTLVGTVGETAVVPAELAGWNVARAVAVVPIRDDVGSYWVKLALEAPAVRETIQGRLNTTVQATLNLKDVDELPILMPSREERHAIASVIGALDDRIELNRCMNQALEAIAQAIFKSWFVDFDPVTAKLEGEDEASICQRFGLNRAELAEFPSEFVGVNSFLIPLGWEMSKLGDHVLVHDAKRVPLSNRERAERPGSYPYYGAATVMDHIDGYLFEGVHVLMGEDGSVTQSNGAPVLQYIWNRFWVNNHAHVLTAVPPMTNEHLLLLLKSLNIAPFVTGAVQAKLSQGNLRRIPVVAPPAAVAKAFGEHVAPLFSQIRSLEENTQTLTDARAALLPRLLSGELAVKDGVNG